MPTNDLLFVAVAALFGLWLLSIRNRRRIAQGRLTEAERRFDATLARFKVEVDRFKFTRQGAVKILLSHDHAVSAEIERMAMTGDHSRADLRLRVHRYVSEIVPFFKPLAYYRFGYTLAKTVLNLLYRLDFRPEEVARVKGASSKGPTSIIYLANHRSNVDYVLAAYVLAEKLALSFAVGEWARVWPLEYLFKAFGSYFLRRGCRDQLYHTVLRRYVQLVTKNAVTQALFPEGGLSRDGLLRPPKIGLLDNILCSKEDRSFTRELVFVPVAINYDRVLEDRALLAESGKERPKRGKGAMAFQVGRILFANVSKFARRKIHKNGVAAVRFGEPVSFDQWHAERGVDIFSLSKQERRGHVADFCNDMMAKIAALVPATPLCVVAKVLLEVPDEQQGFSRAELTERTGYEIKSLKQMNVDVACGEQSPDWFVEGALLRFELRGLTEKHNGRFVITQQGRGVLPYYANAIAHHYDGSVPEVERPGYAG